MVEAGVSVKTKAEKWGWLTRLLLVLVIGMFLYYCTTILPKYPALFVAAIIHIMEEIMRQLGRLAKLSEGAQKKIEKLGMIFLTIAFSLYAYAVMQFWGGIAIISILILGGLLEAARRWAKPHSIISFSIGFCILFCSIFTGTIPNVLLKNKEEAAKSAEEYKFFLRGFTTDDESREDGVIVRQEPALGGGILGTNLVFVYRGHHTRLSFLPFPVWKRLRYELGDIPEVKIEALRKGHGDSGTAKIEIGEEDKKTISQFTRIYGTFKNLPRDNEQLFLRVLIMPDISLPPIVNTMIQRWNVQPHERYRPGNKFRDSAELRMEYNDSSDRDGTWYVDGFFGAPQDKKWPFEIRAMITWKDFKRGKVYAPEEIDKMQNRLDDETRRATEANLKVIREE